MNGGWTEAMAFARRLVVEHGVPREDALQILLSPFEAKDDAVKLERAGNVLADLMSTFSDMGRLERGAESTIQQRRAVLACHHVHETLRALMGELDDSLTPATLDSDPPP